MAEEADVAMAETPASESKTGEPEHVLSAAEDCEGSDPPQALSLYQSILDNASLDYSKEGSKMKESAVYGMARVLAKQEDAARLVRLLDDVKPFFSTLPRARIAKIVRTILSTVTESAGSLEVQVQLYQGAVSWCEVEKRTFLRQRLQAKLVDLWVKQKQFGQALELIKTLVLEVKRIDDKALLVEIHLTESRVHHALRNIPKSKAALTAARTNSNAIYVAPILQAQIDMMAGTLNAEEKDFNTAYSYFFEAFESFDNQRNEEEQARFCLKYMLLCRIMGGNTQEVVSIMSGKYGIKYAAVDLNAMKAVADAYAARSLEQFEQARKDFVDELSGDDLVKRHLDDLYETMLEQNLVRIIEPYSRVELSHVANLIKLPEAEVVQKLSQMILDGKFSGTLDQGQGHLLVFDPPPADLAFSHTIDALKRMDAVVASLSVQAENVALRA